ncbi:MAG: UDP-N-acetylglucosamine--N-acetylmuramyl-(pentapeptide) pyrophosphoryl-undecaprenol N-acetylglucosamine transferase [Acidimicrobiales bacterium]
MTKDLFAVITGGGTGGHVSPALAVAEALVHKGHPASEIEFVGARRGIEGRLVPDAGFELHALPGRGIRRSITIDNISSLLGLIVAVLISLAMALRKRPQVVVTVGGYAGFPYAVAGVLLGIPLVVVNVDAVPGAVNRLAGRFAVANAVSVAGTPLPRAMVTGPPLRRGVLEVSRDPEATAKVRQRLGIDAGRQLVLVTGGSLGAGSINAATIELCKLWRGHGDVAVYHVAGDRNLEAVGVLADGAGLFTIPPEELQYGLVGFDSELVSVMGACDLAVCRAGAVTLAELTAIGVPSVLVPLPGAPGDHQARNAAVLVSAGAALSLEDSCCTGENLARLVGDCLGDSDRLAAMATAARSLGRRDAADRVAELVEKAAARAGRTQL